MEIPEKRRGVLVCVGGHHPISEGRAPAACMGDAPVWRAGGSGRLHSPGLAGAGLKPALQLVPEPEPRPSRISARSPCIPPPASSQVLVPAAVCALGHKPAA